MSAGPSSTLEERASDEVADATAVDSAEGLWSRRAAREWWHPLLRRMLALADVTAVLLATLSVAFAGGDGGAPLPWSLAFLPAWIVVAKLFGLYDRDRPALRHLTVDETPQLVLWAVVGTVSLSVFLWLVPSARLDAASALVVGAVAFISAVVLRALARRLWRAVTPPERTAVIGTAASIDAFRRKLRLFPDMHLALVTQQESPEFDEEIDRDWLTSVDRLVYAPGSLDAEQARDVVEAARALSLVLNVVLPCHDVFGPAVRLNHLAELPLLEFRTGELSRSTLFLKRALDVIVSAIGLVALAPIILIIASAIKLDSKGPVQFVQTRAGEAGRPFRMRKFRSMVEDAEELLEGLVSFDALDEPMFKLRDDPRVTRVGRVLRRWSLDELPQLWNVLVGEMSLVGPRPEQLELVDRYTPEQRLRLEVKPGITGPMQVYGRGNLTLTERLAVERDYIDNLSVTRDLRLLAMTLPVVSSRRGAY